MALAAMLAPCAAAEPEPDFHLVDLNPNSARHGQTISPRDYGQWLSVWYFGNES